MSKEMQMVEEIANSLKGYYQSARRDAEQDYWPEDWTWVEELAKIYITCIGKAYADGVLMLAKVPPKLPGEVGRGYADVVKNNPITYQIEGFIKSAEDLSDAVDVPLIALSPFPRDPLGTGIPVEGKEEEKPVNCKCGKVATHICSASGCVVALCDDCECPHGS